MGLVQAPGDVIDDTMESINVDKVKIIWGNDIVAMNSIYGTLVIDYLDGFFGTGFHIAFKGRTC